MGESSEVLPRRGREEGTREVEGERKIDHGSLKDPVARVRRRNGGGRTSSNKTKGKKEQCNS